AAYTRPSAPYVQEPVADSEHLGTAALILDASPLTCSPEGGQKCQTHCRPRLTRTAWSWKTTECECSNIEVRLVRKPRCTHTRTSSPSRYEEVRFALLWRTVRPTMRTWPTARQASSLQPST